MTTEEITAKCQALIDKGCKISLERLIASEMAKQQREKGEWRKESAKSANRTSMNNIVVAESNETHYEMLRRNALRNLPSSLR